MRIVPCCFECGKPLRESEEEGYMCDRCYAKLENDLRIMEQEEQIDQDVFQII